MPTVSPVSPLIISGYTFDQKKFTIANVGEAAVQKQLTELATATKYVIKEIMFFFGGTAEDDAYVHANTAATDVAGTRFGETYYNVFSAIIFDDNTNGIINADLSAKPYLYASAGTGSSAQTVYGVIKYYYKA